MTAQSGSYRFDSLEEQVQIQEFERLYRQASSLLDIERQIWPKVGIHSGQKVLDVGCGTGAVTQAIAKQTAPTTVVGVDISQKLLSQSEPSSQNVAWKQGSVYSLPFEDNSFDVVYARLLLQHLNEPLTALANIFRVLKPNGIACIVDVDKDWSSLYPEPDSSIALDRAIIEKQLSQGGDPWVGRKLGSYLKSSGFSGVETSIKLVDSDQLGLASFFGMLSLGGSYQSENKQFQSLRQAIEPDIRALINNPNTWAGCALFVATGRKPTSL